MSTVNAAMHTVFVLCMLQFAAASWDGTWYSGRATRYGALGDPWTINDGSCGYGYLDQHVATGWDVAAESDQNWDYSATGSCGRCFEIGCEDVNFKDGYGQYLDRSSVCYDTSATVVIQITDTCPCNYPPNAYSNKRWCCGDMYHLDLSQWAFEKLADPMWGVIGIKFRPVACNYQPDKPAPAIANPSPGYAPPSGWNPSMDKRPWP